MATFLLAWELGGGLGHLGRLCPVADGLRRRGHRVVLAATDLVNACRLMSDVPCLPAPIHIPQTPRTIARPSTFADILYNAGWFDTDILQGLVSSWHAMFDLVAPEVVVMDFSPTALLALQRWPARTVLLGSGHACPPDVSPLPDMCPWRDNYPDRLRATEDQVLAHLNRQLDQQGAATLDRVGQLFARVDANLLTTFPELDHYPERGDGDYRGVIGQLPGERPDWPKGQRPRVFVYLKPSASCDALLSELRRRELSTLAFMPKCNAAQHGTLRITDRPLAIDEIASSCDLAIVNAGHNTVARLLVAGRPILALPISGEQETVANNAARVGAAKKAAVDRPEDALPALEAMLKDDTYARAAQQFSCKYADFDVDRALETILDSLEAQAPGLGRSSS